MGEGDLAVPFSFGWTYLNLNLPLDAPFGDVDFGTSGFIAQSFVVTSSSASGRFEVGYPAIALTSACEDVNPELNAFGDSRLLSLIETSSASERPGLTPGAFAFGPNRPFFWRIS